jgi:N-acyl-L-homoserine lactone synthetase
LHKFVADGFVLKRGLATVPYELFAGMIEFGLSRQLTDIVSVTDARMERILRRAGWPLRRMSFAENWQTSCHPYFYAIVADFHTRVQYLFSKPSYPILMNSHHSRSGTVRGVRRVARDTRNSRSESEYQNV